MTAGTDRPRTYGAVRLPIAAALALAGLVMLALALPRPSVPGPPADGATLGDAGSPVPTARPPSESPRPTPRGGSAGLQDRVRGPVLPESDPVTVAIPRIGVRSRLVELGLDAVGAMEVPEPSRAGWYTRSAAPGALGPAVIAGHVTWDGAPDIFHRLGTLQRGDRVTVTRQDGRTAVFTVDRVARFPKSEFPSEAVYGAIDHAGLRLITCGGTYDRANRRYLDNVVVFARLVAVRGSRS